MRERKGILLKHLTAVISNNGEQIMITQKESEDIADKGTGLVLLSLASAQFLMTLDSSVMNVAIATVAKDVGTTIQGSRAPSRSTHSRWRP